MKQAWGVPKLCPFCHQRESIWPDANGVVVEPLLGS